MSNHALSARGVAAGRAGFGTNAGRLVLLAALIPVLLLYLLPRVLDLVATPYRLDAAVEHADRYNPGLEQIAQHEQVTLSAFESLDQIKASLAEVRATDAEVARQLGILVRQITGDVQATLDGANANVGELVGSLRSLAAAVKNLHQPVDGAGAAVTADRATLARILAEARATARKVHEARTSADRSSSNVSGK